MTAAFHSVLWNSLQVLGKGILDITNIEEITEEGDVNAASLLP